MQRTIEETDAIETVKLLLGVARLGEQDLRGWWRSHGLDRTGRYVLSELFPHTWRPAAAELNVASAAFIHGELLGRPTALHLFSDYLPFRRWTGAWLSEQKTFKPDPLFDVIANWDEPTAVATIREWAGIEETPPTEALGNGLLLGTLTRRESESTDQLDALVRRLATAYLHQDRHLKPPYMDLVIE